MKDFKDFETTEREYVTNTVKLNKENQELKQDFKNWQVKKQI